jgi:hypothetical protein
MPSTRACIKIKRRRRRKKKEEEKKALETGHECPERE